ncbi:tail fiber assembly protein [Pantoea ananatis]|uniref:tail fiber assembly protein n=1 Tax=Pantoea ananas TaxID=553 RepID=UPI001F4EA399|nr:tail fiber assembly protein [Pantoea ananatis]MCH9270161.1 tail fiber assembly protein [Pantoea ananatis]
MAAKKNITLDSDGLAVTSGTLTVYSFDPATGEYTGAADEYLAQGVGIPAHSTDVAPPQSASGKACVFQGGSWQQVADRRGEIVYSTATGAPVLVTLPGDYPAGTTQLKPQTPFDTWGGVAWVTDTAAQQRAAVATAEAEKGSRISEAGSVTQVWQTQLALGIISADDKAQLTAWMRYIQQVQATDTASAPDISWPEKPAS